MIYIAAGIATILAVIAAAFFLLKKKQTGDTILLLGVSDAGKTALYTLIRFGKKAATVTSMKENQSSVTLGNKTFDLVDMPGHERIRYRYSEFIPVGRGIVYVIDSTTVSRQIRPVAEYLYNVLASLEAQKRKMPVLIACNKADMITALPKDKIQALLEAEINRLRGTRTAAVEQQNSEGDDQESFLGYEGEAFRFEHLETMVDFETCSVQKEEIETVTGWIASL
ncbi:signal recognition particle receptor beta subunit-domain-containing protein [Phycomyces nitens]|nr:signal recognition particle receptor beta subunit-domain-containing protein [Phycomyces nitens]